MHALSTATPQHSLPDSPHWPRWPLDLILTVLFLGPVLSPLFRATGQPLMVETGLLAREVLTLYICPTPGQSYTVLAYPMAVCARCWGATIGLWLARLWLPLALRRAGPAVLAQPAATLLGWFRGQHWGLRLLLCGLPFLLWPLEIVGTGQGWWFAPLWLLAINGAQAGFFAGLFFSSVWPGFWPQPSQRPVSAAGFAAG